MDAHMGAYKLARPCACDPVRVERFGIGIYKMHLESCKGRAAVVVSSGWRLRATQPGHAAPVEGGLDGDGGVAGAVEPQGLSVTRQGRVAGDDPG